MTEELNETTDPKPLTPSQYILYKLDRTLAVVGIVLIALGAMIWLKVADAQQVAIAGISGLVGYIGGRAGK